MGTIEGLILTFVLNALWQVPAVLLACGLGDRLLRRAPARLRHALWLAALAACVLLPAASLLRSDPNLSSVRQPASGAVPAATQATESAGWLAWLDSGKGHPTPVAPAAASLVAGLYGLSLLLHGRGLARAWRTARRLANRAQPLEIPAAVDLRHLEGFLAAVGQEHAVASLPWPACRALRPGRRQRSRGSPIVSSKSWRSGLAKQRGRSRGVPRDAKPV